jgi:hypothetical protein
MKNYSASSSGGPMSELLATHIFLLDACCAMMFVVVPVSLHILHSSTHYKSDWALKSASLKFGYTFLQPYTTIY